MSYRVRRKRRQRNEVWIGTVYGETQDWCFMANAPVVTERFRFPPQRRVWPAVSRTDQCAWYRWGDDHYDEYLESFT